MTDKGLNQAVFISEHGCLSLELTPRLILHSFQDADPDFSGRSADKKKKNKLFNRKVLYLILSLVAIASFSKVQASIFSSQIYFVDNESKDGNSQNIALLDPAVADAYSLGGGEINIEQGALVADASLQGGSDLVTPAGGQISVYVVRPGDTLSQIADMFDVSVNTINWSNDLNPGSAISPGQVLVILPISGVKYTVKEGDTLASVAKKFSGDATEILQFNGLKSESLIAGAEIIIPNGVVSSTKPSSPTRTTSPSRVAVSSGPSGDASGYFIRPISGGTRTQGLHGYNGVDLASFNGAEIYASAGGQVIVSRSSGWNGGYGNYIVVKHSNGSQTLYAHLSQNMVGVGQQVAQGQVIGLMGSSGRSSGPHLHFEVRGAANPF